MEKIKRYRIISAMIVCIALGSFSCTEETEKEVVFSRLFKPPVLNTSINGVSVTFTWTAVGDGLYALEVSRDSLLFLTDLQIFEVDEKVTFTVDDLYSSTRYSARIKAISRNPEIEDSGYKMITFTTGVENILYAVTDGDISKSSVLLKWAKGKNVSHIVISAAGVDDRMVTLSGSDLNAGEILIEELNPGTKYTFTIYLETRIRGTISATTKS